MSAPETVNQQRTRNSKMFEAREQRGGNLIVALWHRLPRKGLRIWDSWAAHDQVVIEIPREGSWPAAQSIISYTDAARLRDYLTRIIESAVLESDRTDGQSS